MSCCGDNRCPNERKQSEDATKTHSTYFSDCGCVTEALRRANEALEKADEMATEIDYEFGFNENDGHIGLGKAFLKYRAARAAAPTNQGQENKG